jgi:uncharacterized protein YoxC
METLNVITASAEIILFITLAIFIIYISRAAGKITSSIENIENGIKKINNDFQPVLNDLTLITHDLKTITQTSKIHISKLGMLSDAVSAKGHELLDTMDMLQARTSGYMSRGLNFFNAVGRGYSVFINKLRN